MCTTTSKRAILGKGHTLEYVCALRPVRVRLCWDILWTVHYDQKDFAGTFSGVCAQTTHSIAASYGCFQVDDFPEEHFYCSSCETFTDCRQLFIRTFSVIRASCFAFDNRSAHSGGDSDKQLKAKLGGAIPLALVCHINGNGQYQILAK